MSLKIGMDMYAYHRHFGEVYPEPKIPKMKMTTIEFLHRAKELDVDGVTVETCFVESFEEEYLKELKAIMDDYNFDRVWSWGHPDGLEGGNNEAAFTDMIKHIEYSKMIGADVMRVVGSSLAFRFEPHEPQLEKLTIMFKEAVKVAEDYEIKLADENHFDFDSDEFLRLIEAVDSPHFGLTFDTGNFFRMLDEPVKAMEKLGKYTYATHIKDLRVTPNTATDEWFFFSSVVAGEGHVNLRQLAKMLKDFDFQGMLAFEIDYLHPDYEDEDAVIAQSIDYLKQLVTEI